MAKLIDDPKVVALMERHAAKVVRELKVRINSAAKVALIAEKSEENTDKVQRNAAVAAAKRVVAAIGAVLK